MKPLPRREINKTRIARAVWYRRYSRYLRSLAVFFAAIRYTAVYRDLGDTGIVTYVSTISVEVGPSHR